MSGTALHWGGLGLAQECDLSVWEQTWEVGGWCWDLQGAHLGCVLLSLQFSGANQLRDSITALYPTGVSDFDWVSFG